MSERTDIGGVGGGGGVTAHYCNLWHSNNSRIRFLDSFDLQQKYPQLASVLLLYRSFLNVHPKQSVQNMYLSVSARYHIITVIEALLIGSSL